MRAGAGVAWRFAAAAAFAATAALAVILTRGAPLHVSLISSRGTPSATHSLAGAAKHASRVLPACDPARLDVSIAGVSVPADRVVASHDHLYVAGFPVEFTNVSDATCTISGFPKVSAYLASGVQVGNSAGVDTSVIARRIVLAPGASAHAAVVDSVSSVRCRVVAAIGLRVVPPGQTIPLYVRHAVVACSAAGRRAPVFLHVRAIEPGTGAPGGERADRAGTRHVSRPRTAPSARQAA